MKKIFLSLLFVSLIAAGCNRSNPSQPQSGVAYTNSQYGFTFSLPARWSGYKIVADKWQGRSNNVLVDTGPLLSIRHPLWTAQKPRQDIPIMVFTTKQWNDVVAGKLVVSAAPIPPSELGRNSRYVFALPPRYNYAFPVGFEEVEQILAGKPLHAYN